MGGICEVVQYDEVLEIIRNDIQLIADLLPEEKKEEINRPGDSLSMNISYRPVIISSRA